MQIKLTHKKEFHSSISNGHGHNISVDNNTDEEEKNKLRKKIKEKIGLS